MENNLNEETKASEVENAATEELKVEKQNTENLSLETDANSDNANDNSGTSEADEFKNKFLEMNDKYLRLYSEFENFRRRTSKERIELLNTAGEEVIKSVLPVVDDFERALKSFENSDDKTALKEGVELIYHKMMNILQHKGLEPMQSINEPFNADLHEAITQIPAPEENLKGKVVDEVEKGYMLKGKVIRYAKVVVGN